MISNSYVFRLDISFNDKNPSGPQRSLNLVYAISRNGMEPARNIPRDAKAKNNRFYRAKTGMHSGGFMDWRIYGLAIGCYGPLP